MGSQSRGSEGYKQTSKMVYRQQPGMNQSRQAYQPFHSDSSSSIPLRNLRAIEHAPSRSRTVDTTTNNVHAALAASKYPIPVAGGTTSEVTETVEEARHRQDHPKPPRSDHICAENNQSGSDHGDAELGDGGPTHPSMNSDSNYPSNDVNPNHPSSDVNPNQLNTDINLHSDGVAEFDDGGLSHPRFNANLNSGGNAEFGDRGPNDLYFNHPDNPDHHNAGNHPHCDNHHDDGNDQESGRFAHEPRPDIGERSGAAADYYHGDIPWSYHEPSEPPQNSTRDEPAMSDQTGAHYNEVETREISQYSTPDPSVNRNDNGYSNREIQTDTHERGYPDDDKEQDDGCCGCFGCCSDDDDDNQNDEENKDSSCNVM